MRQPTTPARRGALREVGELPDRFALPEVIGRRNPRSGDLLARGVEWGGR